MNVSHHLKIVLQKYFTIERKKMTAIIRKDDLLSENLF